MAARTADPHPSCQRRPIGVAEYWIVDIDAKLVERWRTDDDRPEIVDGELQWTLRAGVSGVIEVPKLFE